MTELEFNKRMCQLYHDITKLEEKTIKGDRNHFILTVNEIHLIECIKNCTKNQEGPTISVIAGELDITRPSTTVAVNKLVAKKYLEKSDCVNDGRSVRVKLTSKGEKAYAMHKNHCTNLIRDFKASVSEEEYETVVKSLETLSDYFGSKLENAASAENEF